MHRYTTVHDSTLQYTTVHYSTLTERRSNPPRTVLSTVADMGKVKSNIYYTTTAVNYYCCEDVKL